METNYDAGLDTIEQNTTSAEVPVHEARLWQDDCWTARVIKNEDGDGWAVAMYQDGQTEPALVGPWTMGRDKVNPKPLDAPAFQTLVKTAREVLRRHEQQLQAQLHRQVTVSVADETVTVALDIIPDEDIPHAILAAVDALGDELASIRVAPGFKLTRAVALSWIESGYRQL
jgi:hypothetical protein